MPEYRRYYQPGGTYFFTVVTEGRAPFLATGTAREILREAFEQTLARWPFNIDAIVLLPDHLHTIWTLPTHDTDYSRRWAFLKKQFTREWLASGGREHEISDSRERNRRRGVWQRRFWEHTVRDERDFELHCDYIHYNPVKHGLATCPHVWPHSSFSRFVREAYYPERWCCVCGDRMPKPLTFDDIKHSIGE